MNRKIHKLEKLLPETSCQRHHDFQLDDLDIDNASEKILDHLKFLIEEGYLSLGKEFKDTTDKIKILREKYDNVIREEIKLTHSKIKLVIFFKIFLTIFSGENWIRVGWICEKKW